jgi:hypothetical protein
MAGTRQPIYAVTIEFHVYAPDDDAARDRVTRVLPKGDLDMAWAWTDTTLTNKGDSNE